MSLPSDFAALPPSEQAQRQRAFREACELAFRYACALIIGPSRNTASPINTASCIIASHRTKHFLITADHVISAFEQRAAQEEELVAYFSSVGRPRPFDPRTRIAFRDRTADVAVLTLGQAEASSSGTLIYNRLPSASQEQDPPRAGEWTLMAGFPRALRQETGRRAIEFGSYVIGTSVTSVFHDRVNSRLERQHWIPSHADALGHDLLDFGGVSGGPVFRTTGMAYELLGVISQHDPGLDYVSCARLDAVPVAVWND